MKGVHHRVVGAARVLLGLIFFVFGLNGFLNFLPAPPVSELAGQFMGGLAASGYFFPLLKTVETVTGALLLTGRFVPLALVTLAPIVVNILAFHLFLEPGGALVAISVTALELYLAWAYRSAFQGVLQSRAAPMSVRPAKGASKPLVDSLA